MWVHVATRRAMSADIKATSIPIIQTTREGKHVLKDGIISTTRAINTKKYQHEQEQEANKTLRSIQ